VVDVDTETDHRTDNPLQAVEWNPGSDGRFAA
jgi:hypothetical protein